MFGSSAIVHTTRSFLQKRNRRVRVLHPSLALLVSFFSSSLFIRHFLFFFFNFLIDHIHLIHAQNQFPSTRQRLRLHFHSQPSQRLLAMITCVSLSLSLGKKEVVCRVHFFLRHPHRLESTKLLC